MMVDGDNLLLTVLCIVVWFLMSMFHTQIFKGLNINYANKRRFD